MFTNCDVISIKMCLLYGIQTFRFSKNAEMAVNGTHGKIVAADIGVASTSNAPSFADALVHGTLHQLSTP